MSARGDAAAMVAEGLRARAPADAPDFLREVMANAAAGLVVIEGAPEAAEAVYRLADAVVSRPGFGPVYCPPIPPPMPRPRGLLSRLCATLANPFQRRI